MRILLFYHSLVSDWNHGNAHFLRGVATELIARGHEVIVYEPRDGWSVHQLRKHHGEAPIRAFHAAYPLLQSREYDLRALDLSKELAGADLVIVHEWNEHELVARIGRVRARYGGFHLLFHDTHHRAVTEPETMAAYDLSHYDGVLAFGKIIRDLYLERGWTNRAWTWHEAADTRIFHPIPRKEPAEGDLVWVGNWGDNERTAELHEFLLDPVKDLQLRARVHGVRYPAAARKALADAGIEYAGWLPNFEAPHVFSKFKMTVHVPRRPYVRALPGIPTIRVFEALACGMPLVSAPWEDVERLFTPGEDFLTARNGAEMRSRLRDLSENEELRQSIARQGLRTIESRHTCRHRVDELLAIYSDLSRGPRASRPAPRSPRPAPRSSSFILPPSSFGGPPSSVPRPSSSIEIAFFGSSLVSAYWNGAATYYRGMIRALSERGRRVTFYEPDAYERQQHRDIPDPDWARVVVYPAEGEEGVRRALEAARHADVIVKASGVGVFDELLEAAVLDVKRSDALAIFWDVDAPATLDRVQNNPNDPFRALIPQYDLVLTYGGGDPVVSAYRALGARECVPIYNALDPETHHPVPPDSRFDGDLGFLGNRLPDREARVEEFFLRAAAQAPRARFLLGGSGWGDKPTPKNVCYLGHIYTRDHNTFNCTPRAVLNVSRESMARYGFSPATRVFEAAGAGACLITDHWDGIELFFEPDVETLVARNGDEVAALVESLTPERAREIGAAAMKRALAHHTYAQRAAQLEALLWS